MWTSLVAKYTYFRQKQLHFTSLKQLFWPILIDWGSNERTKSTYPALARETFKGKSNLLQCTDLTTNPSSLQGTMSKCLISFIPRRRKLLDYQGNKFQFAEKAELWLQQVTTGKKMLQINSQESARIHPKNCNSGRRIKSRISRVPLHTELCVHRVKVEREYQLTFKSKANTCRPNSFKMSMKVSKWVKKQASIGINHI